MYFTEEDYRKIEKWLNNRAVKDTELLEADKLSGQERIAIVQNGINKVTTIKEITNVCIHDFINVTTLVNKCNLSLQEAVNLVPTHKRKLGLAITYRSEKGNWIIMQFTGTSINQWNTLDCWKNVVDLNLDEIHNIYADEEDITEVVSDGKSYFKFRDRHHNSDAFTDKGKVIIRQNLTGSELCSIDDEDHIINILTQDMIAEPNTIYVIQYNFDLQGEPIKVPSGSVLQFEGGSINNGTLTLDNTMVLGAYTYSEIGDATIIGSFHTGQIMTFKEGNRQLLKWWNGTEWKLILDITDYQNIQKAIEGLTTKHNNDLLKLTEDFDKKLEDLDEKIEENIKSIEEIITSIGNLSNEITNIKNLIPKDGFVDNETFSELSSRLDALESQYNTLSQKCETLEENYSTILTEINNIKVTINALQASNSDLEARVTAIENELTNIRATVITNIPLAAGQTTATIDIEAYSPITEGSVSPEYDITINNDDFNITEE